MWVTLATCEMYPRVFIFPKRSGSFSPPSVPHICAVDVFPRFLGSMFLTCTCVVLLTAGYGGGFFDAFDAFMICETILQIIKDPKGDDSSEESLLQFLLLLLLQFRGLL